MGLREAFFKEITESKSSFWYNMQCWMNNYTLDELFKWFQEYIVCCRDVSHMGMGTDFVLEGNQLKEFFNEGTNMNNVIFIMYHDFLEDGKISEASGLDFSLDENKIHIKKRELVK